MGVVTIRRSKIDISSDILNIAQNGASKTQIVYGANLNFDIANRYLEMLQNKGLIKHNGDQYITTEKGKTYHELAKELKL